MVNKLYFFIEWNKRSEEETPYLNSINFAYSNKKRISPKNATKNSKHSFVHCRAYWFSRLIFRIMKDELTSFFNYS